MSLRVVILGLSITSSWGNGHATVYRGLVRQLLRRGHDVLFLERDKPWYAAHRDLRAAAKRKVALYESVEDLKQRFGEAIGSADCVMVGSYVPEGIAVGDWVTRQANGLTVFYDIDTPVTQAKIREGRCEYLSSELVGRYGAYLSFTGGPMLAEIQRLHGVREVRAFYCCVEPEFYFPEPVGKRFDLGYLGTYSADRQPALERLLLAPARRHGAGKFIVGGPMYPESIRWPANVERCDHVAPAEHRAFYNAQRFTLNITREDMTQWGYSPSVRLFEAAACGVPIISDWWPGLAEIFEPGREILTAASTGEVLAYLRWIGAEELEAIATRARERVLREHTAAHRAAELESLIFGARSGHAPTDGAKG